MSNLRRLRIFGNNNVVVPINNEDDVPPEHVPDEHFTPFIPHHIPWVERIDDNIDPDHDVYDGRSEIIPRIIDPVTNQFVSNVPDSRIYITTGEHVNFDTSDSVRRLPGNANYLTDTPAFPIREGRRPTRERVVTLDNSEQASTRRANRREQLALRSQREQEMRPYLQTLQAFHMSPHIPNNIFHDP